ncbi:hypothetical protein SMICM304S_11002 [Streptomyces microflavus]
MEPGGTLVTVHWNHPVPDHRGTGSTLAPIVGSLPGLTLTADHRERDFVLQVYRAHQHRRHGGALSRRPRRTRMTGPSSIEAIAVVIPARDEEDLLPGTLQSVRAAAAHPGIGSVRVLTVVVAELLHGRHR